MTKLVRTTLSNAKLWEYLLQSGLAESIEELEIKRTKPQVNLPVADDVVPSPELVSTEVRDSLEEDLSKDQIAEQQKGQEAFLRLLPRLTALRRFSWQDHPPFKGAEEEDIWAHLAKLPELRELDLVDEQVAEEATSLHDTLQPLQNSSLFKQTFNLQAFRFRSQYYSNPERKDTIDTMSVATFLKRLTDLEILELSFYVQSRPLGVSYESDDEGEDGQGQPLARKENFFSANFDPVFSAQDYAIWPKLRVLHTWHVSSSQETLQRFLEAHTDLQVLNIFFGVGRGTEDDESARGQVLTSLSRDALPNLRIVGENGHRILPALKERGVPEARPGSSAREIEQAL